jgi:hypothetical protein
MSRLAEKLQADYDETRAELARLRELKKQLRWKLHYIKALLESATPTVAPPPKNTWEGMTIADIAVRILSDEGKPLSAMDIAKRAVAGGFPAENLERARSHFSAVISKDLSGARPRFKQIDRGAIGLSGWGPSPNGRPAPEQPFEDEQPFKEDDIPF